MVKSFSESPAWTRDAVFYQIFPDRFANGDPSNDGARTQAWGEPPNRMQRQGGDLAGLRRRFDYLSDLGVNALYLNPIFEAAEYHGYDTTDYYQISSRLGSNAQFANLVQDAHARGWRIVLDGVFNHTGAQFHAFQSLVKENEQSPFRDWYLVRRFPMKSKSGELNYEAFDDNPNMPRLNYANPEVRAYILDVAERWIEEYGIDGWRLDVPGSVPHDFWKAFRQRVRAANPDAYLVGELWEDARDWLQGDEFDGVTNYRWRGAVLSFFGQGEMSPSDFDATLRQIRADYPPAATDFLLNMLSSHDAERLTSFCGSDRRRMGQCALFQLTYPGVPCLYYGDEIALPGADDPNNRPAMPWNEAYWDTGFRAFYKRLIALRRQHRVLRYGEYRTAVADDEKGVFGFTRQDEKACALALFNASDEPQRAELPGAMVDGRSLYDWLGAEGELERVGTRWQIALPPRGLALYGSA